MHYYEDNGTYFEIREGGKVLNIKIFPWNSQIFASSLTEEDISLASKCKGFFKYVKDTRYFPSEGRILCTSPQKAIKMKERLEKEGISYLHIPVVLENDSIRLFFNCLDTESKHYIKDKIIKLNTWQNLVSKDVWVDKLSKVSNKFTIVYPCDIHMNRIKNNREEFETIMKEEGVSDSDGDIFQYDIVSDSDSEHIKFNADQEDVDCIEDIIVLDNRIMTSFKIPNNKLEALALFKDSLFETKGIEIYRKNEQEVTFLYLKHDASWINIITQSLTDGKILDKSLCCYCSESHETIFLKRTTCNCVYCAECLKEVVTKSISSHQLIQCIGCKKDMSIQDIRYGHGNYRKMKLDLLKIHLAKQKKYIMCPVKDCNAIHERIVKRNASNLTSIICMSCNTEICPACDVICSHLHEKHTKEVCDKYQSRPMDEKSTLWIEKNTKECPFCHAHIEKIEGCLHMTCVCEKKFCWTCLKDYNITKCSSETCKTVKNN